jgi:hypothetical protein
MEIFQARALGERFVGGLAVGVTPEPLGPRKRDQPESAARQGRKIVSDARREAVISANLGDTVDEEYGFEVRWERRR